MLPAALSVIIPARNCARHLATLLASLHAAAPPPGGMECIVVDDASTDATAAVAADAGVQVVSLPCQSGPAAARNRGASQAAGEILLFLDADVAVPPGLLQHVVGRFAADPALAAINGHYTAEPLNGGFFPRYKALFIYHALHTAAALESFEASCAAVRTACFRSSGGFNERYCGADVEDYEFGRRLLQGRPIPFDHALLVQHHFPGFRKNAANYFRRTALWCELFVQARRFDSAAATGNEAFARLAAVATAVAAGITCRIPSVLLLLLPAAAIYLTLILPLLRFMARQYGWRFALATVPVHCAESFAIVAGAQYGFARMLTCRHARASCPP